MDNDQVVESLGNLTVVQLIALTKQLEDKWGVKAIPQMVQVTTQQVEVKVEAQTEFSITLVSYPADKKITLIKLMREVMGLGLLEAKSLVEGAPKMIKEGLTKDEMEALKAKLMEAGGVVEIR